jgi:predicted trehalose synthase
MHRWAVSACADAFMKEIDGVRDVALRNLIKKPTEDNAAIVRSFDKVSDLMNEAAKMQ